MENPRSAPALFVALGIFVETSAHKNSLYSDKNTQNQIQTLSNLWKKTRHVQVFTLLRDGGTGEGVNKSPRSIPIANKNKSSSVRLVKSVPLKWPSHLREIKIFHKVKHFLCWFYALRLAADNWWVYNEHVFGMPRSGVPSEYQQQLTKAPEFFSPLHPTGNPNTGIIRRASNECSVFIFYAIQYRQLMK